RGRGARREAGGRTGAGEEGRRGLPAEECRARTRAPLLEPRRGSAEARPLTGSAPVPACYNDACGRVDGNGKRGRAMRRVFLWVVALGTGFLSGVAVAADAPTLEIPEPFARFEHMIGSWKGTAVPAANRLKGWPETHRWAWKFAKGKPVGMAL